MLVLYVVQPVHAYYQGQLLATLENRDLSAAAQETRARTSRLKPHTDQHRRQPARRELKGRAGLQNAQQELNAQKKLYNSRARSL